MAGTTARHRACHTSGTQAWPPSSSFIYVKNPGTGHSPVLKDLTNSIYRPANQVKEEIQEISDMHSAKEKLRNKASAAKEHVDKSKAQAQEKVAAFFPSILFRFLLPNA